MKGEKKLSTNIFISEKFNKMCAEIVAHSQGKIRIAHNEADSSKNIDKEAAHFFKVNEQRVGRDFELYGIMEIIPGPEIALVEFFSEVLLPMKKNFPESYKQGGEILKEIGCTVYPAELKENWINLF